MSFIKKNLRKIRDLGGSPSSSSTSLGDEKATTKDAADSPIIQPVNGSGTIAPDTNGAATPNSESRRRSRDIIEMERKRRSVDKERSKAESKQREHLRRIESERFMQEGPEELTRLYKPLSMNQSKKWGHENRVQFREINFAALEGKTITFRARMHTLRRMSAKLVFIVFRQQTITIQGVLQTFRKQGEVAQDGDGGNGTISEQMVRSIEHYPAETIVVVTGNIRRAPQKVKNATVHDFEIEVSEIHRVTQLAENVPFTVYDAENINRDKEDVEKEEDSSSAGEDISSSASPRSSMAPSSRTSVDMISRNSTDVARHLAAANQTRSLPQRVRLNNRIVDLRTAPSQCIFRIQSGICNLFRTYLDGEGFIEIHTPKLQGGATESGATVFELNYFGRSAFLAQSPQLAKQMCIAADFERVYEIGAVFRAEDSNTPRHLTEYTGLDLEMALEEHYHEALNVIDGMFKHLWQGIYDRYSHEIEIISHFYPHEKVEWLDVTPRIPFSEGVQMLVDDGFKDEDGSSPSPYEDLSTPAERRLGALVKMKYRTDYYILDKFPASARPFYTMPDADNPKITNSFDIFMRGQEILSGGQRIHDAKFLEERMKSLGVKPESMPEYIEGFRWGAPPHAGCGIGLERLTYLFLNLGNIRLASLFPRDPKSLPAKAVTFTLRYEEASTTNPPWENRDIETNTELSKFPQPLEKLIANYGDAANTSWLDERYKVWRQPSTGAAQGYILHNHFAIAVGDPLCSKNQYPSVISGFLQFLKDEYKGVRPIWMIAGSEVEEYLGEKFAWRTLACAAEERADPRNNPAAKDSDLARKLRHAEKEGMKQIALPLNEPVPEDLQQKIDLRIQDWHNNRKGAQIHLTKIRPWIDQEHRRYYYTQGTDGIIHAIVVLHQLSPVNGYQVKFSLEFPGAPSGTIESLILFAMKSITVVDPDTKQVTFGTGAMANLDGGRNMGKTKVKALKRTYETINKQFKLTNKSEFREKMGVVNHPVYVCYPKGGLGPSGIKALLGFLQED
ncbi:aspartyl-tRNA synthetase [Phlyctema vagabunda]|uniref:aspartate--tRNA ligase n=1 Tax=Phlyctema vagabunda TaxID=108571 RepID=A0ABR4PJ93_9HELO